MSVAPPEKPLDPSSSGEGLEGRFDRPIALAVIAGAHGVTGEVRLKLFGEGIATLKRYRAFNDGALTLEKLRDDGKGGALARFAEMRDRNAAERLRGIELTVPRSALPPLAEGEYYHADLIGLPAVSTDGEELGRCVTVENFGAGDIVEIEWPSGKRFLVPVAAVEISPDRLLVDGRFVE